MTYFELISLLDEMEFKERNNEYIATLNNSNVSLVGDRYLRFISHVNYLLNSRLKEYMNKVITLVCDKALSKEELIIELEGVKLEVEYAKNIASIDLIKEENKIKFMSSINENENKIYKSIYDLYEDEEYKLIIKGYIKED